MPTREEVETTIGRLRSDHDFFMKELAQMVKIMRAAVAAETVRREEIEDVKQRLRMIAERLDAHNRLEEKRAYTWPALLFDENEVVALSENLKRELKNLPPRFRGGEE